MTKHNSSTAALEPIFELERTFDAPRQLVYDAWTDAAHLAKWWGPKCFDAECDVDLKVGGNYSFTMIGPDGVRYPMHGVYLEVVRPEKIVMTIVVKDHPEEWHRAVRSAMPDGGYELKEQVMTVTFHESDGKTDLKISTRFATLAERDAFLKIGMNEGWSSSLDKLAELVANLK